MDGSAATASAAAAAAAPSPAPAPVVAAAPAPAGAGDDKSDTKVAPAKRPISLWLPDGRAFGAIFVTPQQLSTLDLASLRARISAEFRDTGSEPAVGPALADDLAGGRFQFVSSGAPITRRQEDTLTALDFGAALMIKPKSFGTSAMPARLAFGAGAATGSASSTMPSALRRLKSSGGYDDFLGGGGLHHPGASAAAAGAGASVVGAAGTPEQDVLSTAVMPSPSMHALSAPLPPPISLSGKARRGGSASPTSGSGTALSPPHAAMSARGPAPFTLGAGTGSGRQSPPPSTTSSGSGSGPLSQRHKQQQQLVAAALGGGASSSSGTMSPPRSGAEAKAPAPTASTGLLAQAGSTLGHVYGTLGSALGIGGGSSSSSTTQSSRLDPVTERPHGGSIGAGASLRSAHNSTSGNVWGASQLAPTPRASRTSGQFYGGTLPHVLPSAASLVRSYQEGTRSPSARADTGATAAATGAAPPRASPGTGDDDGTPLLAQENVTFEQELHGSGGYHHGHGHSHGHGHGEREDVALSAPGELQITVIGRGKGWETFNSTKDVEDMLIDELDAPVWIDVEGYTEADLNALGRKFALHPLTIEDCAVADPREKMEVFAHYMFLVLHASTAYDDDPEAQAIGVQPIMLLLFAKCVVSFHGKGLDTLEHVRQRLSKIYSNRLESTSWVVHGILDCIVDGHFSVVESTVTAVDALDDLIYALSRAEHRDILKRMTEARRRLSYMRQRLWSKRDILVSLVSKDWETFLSGVQIPYLRDVYDHVVRLLQKLEIASELLSSIQSTYLSNVSIDVAEASNNVNAVMKTLSSVATIILPLTLVTGMFGMNVTVPWQNGAAGTASFDDLLPFFILCALMVLIAVFMVWYFRRKRWL